MTSAFSELGARPPLTTASPTANGEILPEKRIELELSEAESESPFTSAPWKLINFN